MSQDSSFIFTQFPDVLSWIGVVFNWLVHTSPSLGSGFKHFLSILVTLSIPASVVFFIMIISTVERLKALRKKEEEIYNAKVEPAFEQTSGGDPKLAMRWTTVTTHMESDNPNDWKQAILEADIMLDDLLTNMGYRGETIGEKLKRVEPAHFQSLPEAWEAHKVRNQIAHESSFAMNQLEARRVVQQYKKVFEEFYFI